MRIVGVICEYNPFHKGHGKQLALIRQLWGEDTGIVCLMSGNFVQRGHPAIVDKSLRARAALRSGADLVLELPVQYALSSAEGFAAGGVEILSPFCDGLCFGAETPDKNAMLDAAEKLLSGEYVQALKEWLGKGLSFPAARQAAMESLGVAASLLNNPNNILGVEYCKAILSQNAAMEPLPIARTGSYHAQDADRENPSATAVRGLMLDGEPWRMYVPEGAFPEEMTMHSLQAGEKAMLARLRSMEEREFETVPYGSEGLWHKLMHQVRTQPSLEEIAQGVKSKRYTRSRIDRMIMCAFLGLKTADLEAKAPYTRVLGFSDRGREILKEARRHGLFLNAGEAYDSPYWAMEQRLGALYGLFAVDGMEAPDVEKKRRVVVPEKEKNHG